MLPRENFDKNGAIWCNLGVPKYAITKLKINNFKVKQSTTTKVNEVPPGGSVLPRSMKIMH